MARLISYRRLLTANNPIKFRQIQYMSLALLEKSGTLIHDQTAPPVLCDLDPCHPQTPRFWSMALEQSLDCISYVKVQ